MFPQVYEHLSTMGMNILTDHERETGYADSDLDDRMKQSLVDYDRESRRDAQKKRAEQTKFIKAERDQKKAVKRDAAPGQEEAGMNAGIGPQMENDIVMPMFPLWLGQMLMQHTDY